MSCDMQTVAEVLHLGMSCSVSQDHITWYIPLAEHDRWAHSFLANLGSNAFACGQCFSVDFCGEQKIKMIASQAQQDSSVREPSRPVDTPGQTWAQQFASKRLAN